MTTADVAAVLRLSVPAASQVMRRLAAQGLWAVKEPADPMVLLEYVTAPHPAYVSLQSALHAHEDYLCHVLGLPNDYKPRLPSKGPRAAPQG